MKVLVLGGTGAMGAHLVQLLADDCIETVVTSRQQRISGGSVRYVRGSAQNIGFLSELLEDNWDIIVDFMVYTTEEFRRRAPLLLKRTSQYVYLSSSRVYAGCDGVITEVAPRLLDVSRDGEFLETDEYALTKARQEDILKASGQRNWTIIRPYITYAENRLQLGVLEKEEWLYRALQRRSIVFSKDISSKLTTMTYGMDVAKTITAVIGKKSALAEVFNVTAANAIKWSDVLAIYLDVLGEYLGERPRVVYQEMNDFMMWKRAKYQIMYDRLFDRQFDNSKINKYLSSEGFVDVQSGLRRCLTCFLENPVFDSINWRAEAIKDRQVGEIPSVGEISGLVQKARYLKNRFL
jgi:nucleoside-diphosphate-sugar epimerase